MPLLFVHGNHDCDEYLGGVGVDPAPGGGVNLDRRSVNFRGLLVGGLQGSIRYRPGPPFQYTDVEMRARAWAMAGRCWPTACSMAAIWIS